MPSSSSPLSARPETKPPAPLLSRQRGFGPASQVAAGTKMKGPSEGHLWQSAQPSLAAVGPAVPQGLPPTAPTQGSLCECQRRSSPANPQGLPSFPFALQVLEKYPVFKECSGPGPDWPDLWQVVKSFMPFNLGNNADNTSPPSPAYWELNPRPSHYVQLPVARLSSNLLRL